MLTKREKCSFMLVKIRHGRIFRFTIPIAFIVIDELIEAFGEVVDVIEGVVPSFKSKNIKDEISAIHLGNKNFSIGKAIRLIQELFYELRRHRGLKLVEVEEADLYVKVELL